MSQTIVAGTNRVSTETDSRIGWQEKVPGIFQNQKTISYLV